MSIERLNELCKDGVLKSLVLLFISTFMYLLLDWMLFAPGNITASPLEEEWLPVFHSFLHGCMSISIVGLVAFGLSVISLEKARPSSHSTMYIMDREHACRVLKGQCLFHAFPMTVTLVAAFFVFPVACALVTCMLSIPLLMDVIAWSIIRKELRAAWAGREKHP